MRKAIFVLIIAVTITFFFSACENNMQANDQDGEQVSESFISSQQHDIQLFDDWIYYTSARDLRKCKKDLSDDVLVDDNVYSFIIHESRLYLHKIKQLDTTSQGFQSELFEVDLNDEEFNPKKVTYFSGEERLYSPILYNDNLFYLSRENSLVKSNIKDNSERIIIDKNISSFGIIDNNVYYQLSGDNCIMKYDIKTKKSATAFQIEKNEDFEFKTTFTDRSIIIQNDYNSFVYIDIDNKKIKKISFDLSKHKFDWSSFGFKDNKNLYFTFSIDYNTSNPLTTPKELYKVSNDTLEPMFLKSIICDAPLYQIDEYIYYVDYDYTIKRIALE